MSEAGWRPRPPTHLNLLAFLLFSLGAFGALAGFTGSASIAILQFATFWFEDIGVSLPLLALSLVSIGSAIVWFAGRPWRPVAAACFVGWAAVSVWMSSAPPENRLFSAVVMVVAALAYLADLRGSPDRALVAQRGD